MALFEEAKLLVELDEFEGGAGSVSFFFGEFVPLVEAAFAMLDVVRAPQYNI